jgi:hypothetical protein
LATGIQSVCGGEIAVIDTEARRALHYASRFNFLHLDFAPPHGPDRYLEAIRAAVQLGAKTIMVDSMSHEHEGEGGVLEWHEAELDRIAGQDWKKREACNLLGWAKPKAAHRKLINGILQLNVNLVFCFRAKEKVKPMKNDKGKTEIVPLGWQAIAGEEFVYEMTDRFLLPPGVNGVPDLSAEAWQTGVPKVPEDHRSIVVPGRALDEEMGAALARWAQGGKPAQRQAAPAAGNDIKTKAAEIERDVRAGDASMPATYLSTLPEDEYQQIWAALAPDVQDELFKAWPKPEESN